MPTSTPGSDYWGGRRLGANLFAEIAGVPRRQHRQAQMALPGRAPRPVGLRLHLAANLATITVNGRRIDAVAEVSKQGFTYVFDRVTGEPVWPIEERPVDTTTDVPGEQP